MDDPSILKIVRATLGYPGRILLKDLDLEINRGSFVALAGANGTGKSTLLKTVIGILKPLQGSVDILPSNGKPSTIGYVPQRETLDPLFPVSCLEVVLMGLSAWKRPGHHFTKQDREWAQECLSKTGSDAWARQRFAQLSGGQSQRVLLARALATKPDFLVLDEPTSGVDEESLLRLGELLRQLNVQRKLSVLLVSHDSQFAKSLADRILLLQNSMVVEATPTYPVPAAGS